MDDMNWHGPAKEYLARLGRDEYRGAFAAHIKAGRKCASYRHTPSEYMRDLIDCLNRNDEEAFKALKMLSGYASAIGV